MRILFGDPDAKTDQNDPAKKASLEALLGPCCEDGLGLTEPTGLCYFCESVRGTALATADLIRSQSLNFTQRRRAIPYELVAFTKYNLSQLETDEEVAAFHEMEMRIAYLLDTVARYSTVDTLKPGSSCAIPARRGEKPAFLVFLEYTRDNLSLTIEGTVYSLLLCIEVFEPEMVYARTHGVAALIEKFEEAGHYPYSDLDRVSVV